MPSIIASIEDFITEIKQDFNIDTTFNVKIILTETIDVEENPHQCLALVTNIINGKKTEPYQCTRQRRYEHFCGLHHNRINQFVPIKKHKETLTTNYYISK
jgi:hypothetical protein